MSDYNLVKIGTVYLTDDGTSGGLPCLVEIDNLPKLYPAYTGGTAVALSGKPHNFTRAVDGKGVELTFKPFALMTGELAALKTLLDTAAGTNAAVNVTIAGEIVDLDLECKVRLPEYLTFPSVTQDDVVPSAVINLIVDSIN